MSRAVFPGAVNASIRLRADGLMDVYVRSQDARPPRTSRYRVLRGVPPDATGMARLAEAGEAEWEDVTVVTPEGDAVCAFAGLEDLRFVPGSRIVTANRCGVAPDCPRGRAVVPHAAVAEVSEDGLRIVELAVLRPEAKNLHGVEGQAIFVDVLRGEIVRRDGTAMPIADLDPALRGYRMSTAAVRDGEGWRCIVHTPHASGYRHRQAVLRLLDPQTSRWSLRAGPEARFADRVLDPNGDRFRYVTTWLPGAAGGEDLTASGAGDRAAVVEIGDGGGALPWRTVLAARAPVHVRGTVLVGPGARAAELAEAVFARDPAFRGEILALDAVPVGTRAADAIVWGDGDPASPVLARVVRELGWAGTAVFLCARCRPTWAAAGARALGPGLYLALPANAAAPSAASATRTQCAGPPSIPTAPAENQRAA